ncbi:MAG: 30S ribosomal protein S6 [Lactobacillaceae bacterium]|nr:30S ribosomal protein S6 [Lactobacillaceae bacterium]
MTNYESVIIARQDLASNQLNTIISDMSEIISKNGGQIVRVDSWGLKNLAYRIKKNRKGHYFLLNISAPAKAVAEYQRILGLNEDVIRFMTIKVDEFSKAGAEDSKETNEVEGE